MTVNELIAELNKIEDKDRPVKLYYATHDLLVTGIHKTKFDPSVRLKLERLDADDYFDF